jgi:hypothetical protein
LNSFQVTPARAQTVRPAGSTRIPFIGEVDHESAVGDRQAGHAVPAAADRDLDRLLTAGAHRIHDVQDGAAPGDERGTLVDQAVVHPGRPAHTLGPPGRSARR